MPKPLDVLGKAFRDDETVTAGINKYLTLHPPVEEDRRGDCIHPSEVAKPNWCPRSTYYGIIGVPVLVVPASMAMQMVFERGHEDHRKWQHWAWQMGILEGAWRCLRCDLYWFDCSPHECPRCEAPIGLIRYAEVPVASEEFMIYGHADGIIAWGGKRKLWEIKTIGTGTVNIEAPALVERYSYTHKDENGNEHTGTDWAKLWRNIRRPFASHLKQGMIYLYCTGFESIIFVYDPKFLTAWPKEFEISLQLDIIQPILDDCRVVKKAVEVGRPPRRPVWAREDIPTCMSCPYYNRCWHRDGRSNGAAV